MSINQKKYIDVISGIGGEAEVGRKSLGARLLVKNALVSTGRVLEFTSAADVGAYFGTDTREYTFAAKYFGFVSKAVTRADRISFARYTPEAVTATLRAVKSETALAAWQAVTEGSMIVTINGFSFQIADASFSSASTLNDVAGLVQSAIRANNSAGEAWSQAVVSYANNVFTLTCGESGAMSIAFAGPPENGADISAMLGWNQASMPVVSGGAAAETITAALDRIADLSNNFGSFAFIDELTIAEIAEAAAWTALQNVQYLYSVNVTPANYLQIREAVKGKDGVALTYDINDSMAEFMPMALMAATDYSRVNGVINYMYQPFNDEMAAVTETVLSDVLDAEAINYLGQTQQAGKQITFYQRGFLQGEISDIGVFANEIWLKDGLITEWLNMFLALNKIPASESGVDRMRTAAQSVLDEAKNNGTILPGKTLTQVQKAYITEQTGEDDAWHQVYTQGYWLRPVLQQRLNSAGEVEYYLNYVLIYSKGDSIRKVEGSNILI